MAAKKVSSVYTEIRARMDKYEKDLAKARGITTKSTGRMQKRINKLSFDSATKSLQKFIGAFAVAASVKSFLGFMGDAVELHASWERRLLRTEALIKSTGAAAGFSAMQLESFAVEMDKSTLFDKRGIMDAINVMQTFRKVQGSTFKQAIRLSADLAEINQTSVKASAMQLAKILEAPDRLLSSLTRSGIIFDKAQENVIKSLVKSNRLLEAQRIILNKLQTEIGGAATGAGGGVAGKIDLLAYKWGEFKESMSQTDVAVSGIEKIGTTLDTLTEKIKSGELTEVAKKLFYTFTPLGRGLAGFEQLKEAWRDYWQFFTDLENGIIRNKMPARPVVIRKKMPVSPEPINKAAAPQEDYFPPVPDLSGYERGRFGISDAIYDNMNKSSEDAYESMSSHVFEWEDDTKKAYESVGQSVTSMSYAMSDALANFAITGKLDFKSMADSIIADLVRMQSRMLMMKMFEGIGGAIGGTSAVGAATIRGGAGGGYGFDSGGHIGENVKGVGMRSGKSYEFHPNETVIPDRDLATTQVAGGNGQQPINVYNITAMDSQSIEQSLRRSGAVPMLAAENLSGNGMLRQAMLENM